MQRNPIYAALELQLSQGLIAPPYGVKVVSRGFVPWDQATEQPAVYMVPMKEGSKYTRGLPNVWMIHLDLYVYVQWVDSIEQGVIELGNVMDGIDFILSPQGPNGSKNPNQAVNTLGGLVNYCALSGEAEISGGFLNKQQTVARMPVEILVPG